MEMAVRSWRDGAYGEMGGGGGAVNVVVVVVPSPLIPSYVNLFGSQVRSFMDKAWFLLIPVGKSLK